MSKQIILHVGHPKTGTTSIQQTMAEDRERLENYGILYPKTDILDHNHRVLILDIFGGIGHTLRLKMGADDSVAREKSAAAWESVAEQVRSSRAEKVVLSAEGFFGGLDRLPGKRLRERFSTIPHDDIRVLGYIRSPISYYLSKLGQKLRGLGELPQPSPFNRAKSIEAYREHLGVPIETRTFERDKLINKDVVDDFFEWIGASDFQAKELKRSANTGVSAEALELLFRLRPQKQFASLAEMKEHRIKSKLLKAIDDELPNPTKPKLRPELIELVTRLNSEVVVLRDEYGVEFSDIDYDLAGRTSFFSIPRFENFSDICNFDLDRMKEMRVLLRKKAKQRQRKDERRAKRRMERSVSVE